MTVPAAPVVPATPTAVPAPADSGNHFVLVQKRLWDVIENGGSLDGLSVHCGLARELLVNVLDQFSWAARVGALVLLLHGRCDNRPVWGDAIRSPVHLFSILEG